MSSAQTKKKPNINVNRNIGKQPSGAKQQQPKVKKANEIPQLPPSKLIKPKKEEIKSNPEIDSFRAQLEQQNNEPLLPQDSQDFESIEVIKPISGANQENLAPNSINKNGKNQEVAKLIKEIKSEPASQNQTLSPRNGKEAVLKPAIQALRDASSSPSKRLNSMKGRMQKWQGQAQRRQSRGSLNNSKSFDQNQNNPSASQERIGIKSPARGLNDSKGSQGRKNSGRRQTLQHSVNTIVRKDPSKQQNRQQPQNIQIQNKQNGNGSPQRPRAPIIYSNNQADSMVLETDDSAVHPRDIKLQIMEDPDGQQQVLDSGRSGVHQQQAQNSKDDPTKQALIDLKELFENKIKTKWTGGKRQQYDRLKNFSRISNINQLENIEPIPCKVEMSNLCRIVISVPKTHKFNLVDGQSSSSKSSTDATSKLCLRIGATLFDTLSGQFVGRTCQPKGIQLQVDKKSGSYRIQNNQDAVYEIYFYASAEEYFNIVFDIWLERKNPQNKEPTMRKSLGWHFTPLLCLPGIRQQLLQKSGSSTQSNKFQLLKGSQRMMMNPVKTSFVPSNEQLIVTVDSEQLSQKLQLDLAHLRNLVPMGALFSDDDSVPGIHCPFKNVQDAQRDQDSQVVLAIRGLKSVHLNLKEKCNLHLIRMRVHYLNCNEKSLLRMVRGRFQLKIDHADFKMQVTQRRLNISMHNTWLNIGQTQSFNLAAPVKSGENRQILEACANIQLEQVFMDPKICLFFEVVLEVKIETRDKVFKEDITLATFPYIPQVTLTRLQPLSIGDDYILDSISAEIPRERTALGTFSHVTPVKGAEIILEGIVSEKDTILKQVEIREQEKQYQAKLDKMRRNRRRELARQGEAAKQEEDIEEDEEIVQAQIEQQILSDQLDAARNKYVRFVQESEMLKFQTDDTTGMNYFDSIQRVIKEGKIEVNSLKKTFRANIKTLKALEKSQGKGICDFEDSDEEHERLVREAQVGKIAAFVTQIEFESRALTREEAAYLFAEIKLPNTTQKQIQQLAEPTDKDNILLHKEAADSLRINHLQFQVAKVQINADQLTAWDMQTHLEIEEFKLNEDTDQEFGLELNFGNFPIKKSRMTLLAEQKGRLKEVPTFSYDDIQCQLNRDLADYFKMFYSGGVQLSLTLPQGPNFATCQVDIKQSLRQRKEQSLIAYEADIFDTVLWQKIGTLTLVVKHTGQFVNPQTLARVNRLVDQPSTVKKVRARDPQWLKIRSEEEEEQKRESPVASDEDIVEENLSRPGAAAAKILKQKKQSAEKVQAVEVEVVEDERKLRRIAAFKQRLSRQVAETRNDMKIIPPRVCTHSRSRSGSRDSSPASSMNRPLSASLVAAVRDRCIQPQVVHMTEEDFIRQKKKQLKPQMVLPDMNQVFTGERSIDLRVGEPTFFYVLLENPREGQPRTFTLTISNANVKVESLIKMITNTSEIDYWKQCGRIEADSPFEGKLVDYISSTNVVKDCALQNEIVLEGMQALAVPFIIRSYKKTSFTKEKFQVKATYKEAIQGVVAGESEPENSQQIRHEIHKFIVNERFQPTMSLQAFEACIVKDQNSRQTMIKLIPNFRRFFREKLRPNYLGEADTLIKRLQFKSNLGKVTLSQDGDCLEFDPVEVPTLSPQIDLLVFAYQIRHGTGKDGQSISLANPYDLAHAFQFKLRLVNPETLLKIQADQMPQKPEKDETERDFDPQVRLDQIMQDLKDKEEEAKQEEEKKQAEIQQAKIATDVQVEDYKDSDLVKKEPLLEDQQNIPKVENDSPKKINDDLDNLPQPASISVQPDNSQLVKENENSIAAIVEAQLEKPNQSVEEQKKPVQGLKQLDQEQDAQSARTTSSKGKKKKKKVKRRSKKSTEQSVDGYSISNTSFREEVKVDEIKQKVERLNTERNESSANKKEMDGAVFSQIMKKALAKRLSSMFEKPDAQEMVLHRKLTTTQRNADIERLLQFKSVKAFKKVARIGEHYSIRQQLGAGNFGSVHLGHHLKSGMTCAIKIIKKTKQEIHEQLNKNELTILENTIHPHISRIFELLEDNHNYYIAMELITGGNLFEAVTRQGRFFEPEAAKLIKQIVLAMNYMHNQNIMHRDLKPENLMCEKDGSEIVVKLTDFGFATYFVPNQAQTLSLGSPAYMAPELCQQQAYDKKVDVWATGVITFLLLSGQLPFNGQNKEEAWAKVINTEPDYSRTLSRASAPAKNFIQACLTKQAAQRPTMEDLLEFEWLKSDINLEQLSEEQKIDISNNLKAFSEMSTFQSGVCSIIANLMTCAQDHSEIRKIFIGLDSNGDGFISLEELESGLSEVSQIYVKDEGSVRAMFRAADSNIDGRIDYNEFLTAALKKEMLISSGNLRSAFALLDSNTNGVISKENLMTVIGGANVINIQDQSIWDDIFKEVDANNDQLISYEEFEAAMTRVIKQRTEETEQVVKLKQSLNNQPVEDPKSLNTSAIVAPPTTTDIVKQAPLPETALQSNSKPEAKKKKVAIKVNIAALDEQKDGTTAQNPAIKKEAESKPAVEESKEGESNNNSLNVSNVSLPKDLTQLQARRPALRSSKDKVAEAPTRTPL